jgi:hypothetical protein
MSVLGTIPSSSATLGVGEPSLVSGFNEELTLATGFIGVRRA